MVNRAPTKSTDHDIGLSAGYRSFVTMNPAPPIGEQSGLVNTIIGSSVISHFRGPTNRVERDNRQVADGLDLVHLIVLIDGQTVSSQDGRRNLISSRQVVLMRSKSSFSFRTFGPVEMVGFSGPCAMLPPTFAKLLKRVTATPLAPSNAATRAVARMIGLVVSDGVPTLASAAQSEAELFLLTAELITEQLAQSAHQGRHAFSWLRQPSLARALG